MEFQQSEFSEKIGKKIGYIFGVFLFTTMLTLIITLSKGSFEQSHIFISICVVAVIIITGSILRWVLK